MLTFNVIGSNQSFPNVSQNSIYLRVDNWNDFSFVTMFEVLLYDEDGQPHELGWVKIGFKGQTKEISTRSKLPSNFTSLDDSFFSLGQSVDYYKILADLPQDLSSLFLHSIRDITANQDIIDDITEESVFSVSLLRDTSLSVIKGQYYRVLSGGVEQTDFDFNYIRPDEGYFGGIDLNFNVEVGSMPTSNIHALIGRNGVGKTTILNGMIDAITKKDNSPGGFFESDMFGQKKPINESYFSSLVSVSFSAFDPFIPPVEQSDPAKGTCYYYLGLKEPDKPDYHRTITSLHKDCALYLSRCFNDQGKANRWFNAINKLCSDKNFEAMNLGILEETFQETKDEAREKDNSEEFYELYFKRISQYLQRMSSGHAIVLLTITRLVSTAEEKTLVLIDEPESHLHPPLLSAFLRALSDLLLDRNGVAIIATHSPVVLQEIPSICVWKVVRDGASVSTERPQIETFAENVGVLTSEVFRLEVEQSGFHEIFKQAVNSGKSYEEIINEYRHHIGFEGRAILSSLIALRGSNND